MKTRSWEYVALLGKEDKEALPLEEERWARRLAFLSFVRWVDSKVQDYLGTEKKKVKPLDAPWLVVG